MGSWKQRAIDTIIALVITVLLSIFLDDSIIQPWVDWLHPLGEGPARLLLAALILVVLAPTIMLLHGAVQRDVPERDVPSVRQRPSLWRSSPFLIFATFVAGLVANTIMISWSEQYTPIYVACICLLVVIIAHFLRR